MRQLVLLGAVAACIGFASTHAVAQDVGVGIYVGPQYGYGPYYTQDYSYEADDAYYSARIYSYPRRSDYERETQLTAHDYWVDRETNQN